MRIQVFFLLLCLVVVLSDAGASQQRSKLSRVKAEMHSVAGAISAYRVDHAGAWPPAVAGTQQIDMACLTTPVAYLSRDNAARYQDPFTKVAHRPAPGWYYGYWWIMFGSMAATTVVCHKARGRLFPANGKKRGWAVDCIPGVLVGIAFMRVFTPSLGGVDSTIGSVNETWMSSPGTFHLVIADEGFGVLQSLGPDGDLDMTAEAIRSQSLPADADEHALLPELQYDPTNGTASSGDIIRIIEPPRTPIP